MTARFRQFILITLLLVLIVVLPAGAVTVTGIRATIAENGDTTIIADYSLTWAEQVIAYPAALPLISASPQKNIRVTAISPDQVEITARNFVRVQQKPDSTTYTTPAFSINDARQELDRLWFGDLIMLDAGTTSVTFVFPDGKVIQHNGLVSVPSFEYTITRP